MNFNERIRGLREDRDFTQKQIATILNTTQSTYSKYERGERQLDIQQLAVLCNFYNITADYFLGFTEKRKPIR